MMTQPRTAPAGFVWRAVATPDQPMQWHVVRADGRLACGVLVVREMGPADEQPDGVCEVCDRLGVATAN